MSPKEQHTADILRTRFREGTLMEIWNDWKWIWSFSRSHWGSIVVYTLFGLCSSGLSLVSGIVSKYLIDSIMTMDLSRLVVLILLLLLSAGLSVAFSSLNSRFSTKLSITMQHDIQAHVFDRLIQSDWMEITKYSTGDLLNRFSGDISTVSGCAVTWLPSVVIQLFTVLSTLAVILYYDPTMALIGCISVPLLFLVSHRLIRKQRDYNRQMRQVSSDMAAFQSETFRNIDTLKGFGVEEKISRDLRKKQSDFRQVALDYNEFTIRTNVMLTSMSTLVQYIALGYCLFRLWQGQILFGTMVLFLQQRSSLQSAFSALISLVPKALSGSIAAERVRELTQLHGEESITGEIPSVSRCGIEIRDVSVCYNPQRPVLSGVTFRVNPGEIIALVGPSGEGKTTLLRLLLGLIRPEDGHLTLWDAQGAVYPIGASTRRCFSYVPQGNTMIAGTVADNLRLANETATDQEMIDALKNACAWEFVRSMPQGIHSPLGEGGKGLSEGQAQRIAIARALLRKAPVLLLDEVTSALDMETERRVLGHLMNLGITCIVTTHRPSVLNQCTRAYRVENGSVTKLTQGEIQELTQMA